MTVDSVLVRLVGVALFFDFLLVTMVIPILPSMFVARELEAGVLFAAKPAFQVLFNPLVARHFENSAALRLGTVVGAIGSMLFGVVRQSFPLLVAVRALQGAASAGVLTGGMSLLLSQHSDDDQGPAASGALLGLTLGVSMGPVFGGPAYDAFGRAWPFCFIGLLMLLLAGLQQAVLSAPDGVSRAVTHELRNLAPTPHNMTPQASVGPSPPATPKQARFADGLSLSPIPSRRRFERVQTEEKALYAEEAGATEVLEVAWAAEPETPPPPPPHPSPSQPRQHGPGHGHGRATAPPVPTAQQQPAEEFDTEVELVPSGPAGGGSEGGATRRATRDDISWRDLMRDSRVLTVAGTMLMVSLTVGALEPIVAYTAYRSYGLHPWQQGLLWGFTVPFMHGLTTLFINFAQRSKAFRAWEPERWVAVGLVLSAVGAPLIGVGPLLRGPSKLGVVLSTLGLAMQGACLGCVITMVQPLVGAIAKHRGDTVAPLMAISNSGQSVGFVVGPLLGAFACRTPATAAEAGSGAKGHAYQGHDHKAKGEAAGGGAGRSATHKGLVKSQEGTPWLPSAPSGAVGSVRSVTSPAKFHTLHANDRVVLGPELRTEAALVAMGWASALLLVPLLKVHRVLRR